MSSQRLMIALAGALFAGLITFIIFSETGTSSPAPLTEKIVSNYYRSLDDTRSFSEDMRLMRQPMVVGDYIGHPQEKPFTPFPEAIASIKASVPAHYEKLAAIVKDHGFDSPEEWAATGQHISQVYDKLGWSQLFLPSPTANVFAKVQKQMEEGAGGSIEGLMPHSPELDAARAQIKKQQEIDLTRNQQAMDAEDAADPDIKALRPFMDRFADYKRKYQKYIKVN